jgi:hypothetical protein
MCQLAYKSTPCRLYSSPSHKNLRNLRPSENIKVNIPRKPNVAFLKREKQWYREIKGLAQVTQLLSGRFGTKT